MMRRRAPKLLPLSEDQQILAEEIQRRWLDPSMYDDCPLAVHISHALAQVIDCMNKNGKPPDFLNALASLRIGYLTLFGDQHMAVLAQLLGDAETVKRVMEHENGHFIVNRIFQRTGEISPGMAIPSIDIQDILQEEGFKA